MGTSIPPGGFIPGHKTPGKLDLSKIIILQPSNEDMNKAVQKITGILSENGLLNQVIITAPRSQTLPTIEISSSVDKETIASLLEQNGAIEIASGKNFYFTGISTVLDGIVVDIKDSGAYL